MPRGTTSRPPEVLEAEEPPLVGEAVVVTVVVMVEVAVAPDPEFEPDPPSFCAAAVPLAAKQELEAKGSDVILRSAVLALWDLGRVLTSSHC